MRFPESGLVDILRDFLAAHELTGRVAAQFRAGELTFGEVQRWVGDDEDATLFRLKERCHTLFRNAEGSGDGASREDLFDLAVGALFHEAMKFRESFYQQAVYGPKIRALQAGSDPEEAALFAEFEKLLDTTGPRLEESLAETEALLAQTRRQLRRLLAAHRDNGLAARFLVENGPAVNAAFEDGLDGLLTEVHGDAGAGYLAAARSYLESGSFQRALGALDEASRRLHAVDELTGLRAYATGMISYLDDRHDEAAEQLDAWLGEGAAVMAEPLADLAHAALTRIAGSDGSSQELASRARSLAERVAPHAPRERRRAAPSA